MNHSPLSQKYICEIDIFLGRKKNGKIISRIKIREEYITDHTAQRFNLLMRTNITRQIIGIYFNGYTMTNTKHWSLYYCGYKAMKY